MCTKSLMRIFLPHALAKAVAFRIEARASECVCPMQVLNMLLNMKRAHSEQLEHARAHGQQQVQRMKARGRWTHKFGNVGD